MHLTSRLISKVGVVEWPNEVREWRVCVRKWHHCGISATGTGHHHWHILQVQCYKAVMAVNEDESGHLKLRHYQLPHTLARGKAFGGRRKSNSICGKFAHSRRLSTPIYRVIRNVHKEI